MILRTRLSIIGTGMIFVSLPCSFTVKSGNAATGEAEGDKQIGDPLVLSILSFLRAFRGCFVVVFLVLVVYIEI